MARIFPLRLGRSSRRGEDKDKKPRISRTGALIRTGVVLLLCGMIGFAVYQVARHMTVGLSTLRTQEIVDESYVQLELYLFRNEAVLQVEGGAITHYAVTDGERVGVGSALGTAYGAGTMTAEQIQETQALLNACGERMALLRELGGSGTPGDARKEADAIDHAYLGLLGAVGRGDLSAANGFAGQMLDGMGRYDILTGNGNADALAALRAEQAELLSGLSAVSTVKTDRGGYFYYETDGYEAVFPYAEAMTMTPEDFRAMTARPAFAAAESTVGKMVYSTTWYAAAYIPVDPNERDENRDRTVEVFQQGLAAGRAYRMTCDDGVELTLTIERLVPDEGGVLLVFSSQDMPAGFAFPRKLRVETVAHAASGYRIPKEALVTLRSDGTDEEVLGVYILAGGVVEFRKVHRNVEREGYIIAATYEEIKAVLDAYTDEEYAAATADGWSYLRLNDNIIIGGNELYEGKMIS